MPFEDYTPKQKKLAMIAEPRDKKTTKRKKEKWHWQKVKEVLKLGENKSGEQNLEKNRALLEKGTCLLQQ
jgi:hypothetical protein